jgi:hypothetical protein
MKIPLPKQKQRDSVEEKLETEGKIIAQVSNFNYLGYLISHDDEHISIKIQRYNKRMV